MTRTRTTLAASAAFVLALALAAGPARAGDVQHPPGLTRFSHPAPVADGLEPDAPAVPGSSAASLRELLEDWDRAGFAAPAKPAQFRVHGRGGRVTSGPGYNAMASLIRAAVHASREGRDRDALAKIARARDLLDRTGVEGGDPPTRTAMAPG